MSDEPHSDSDRINAIEMVVAHLQHDIDQLNSALVQQGNDIRELKRSLELIVQRLPTVTDNKPGKESPWTAENHSSETE